MGLQRRSRVQLVGSSAVKSLGAGWSASLGILAGRYTRSGARQRLLILHAAAPLPSELHSTLLRRVLQLMRCTTRIQALRTLAHFELHMSPSVRHARERLCRCVHSRDKAYRYARMVEPAVLLAPS